MSKPIALKLVGPIPNMKTIVDKRTIKAGTFMVVDLYTGRTQVIRRYSGKEQRQRRDAFVRKNIKLCRKEFSDERGHLSHRRPGGQRLVDRAREQLGYSPSTGSGDIYHMLFCSFADMGYHRPVRGCHCGWCSSRRAL